MKKKIISTLLVGGLTLPAIGIQYKCRSDTKEASRTERKNESNTNMDNNLQTIISKESALLLDSVGVDHISEEEPLLSSPDNPTVSVSSEVKGYFNPRNSKEWAQYKVLRKLISNGNYKTAIRKMHGYYGGSQK